MDCQEETSTHTGTHTSIPIGTGIGRGFRRHVRRGGFTRVSPKYGYQFSYKCHKRDLIRCSSEQHIIQLIWSYSHQHLSYTQIAHRLNQSNILRRGQFWTPQSIRYILSTTLDIDDLFDQLVDEMSTVQLTTQIPMETSA